MLQLMKESKPVQNKTNRIPKEEREVNKKNVKHI